MNTDFLERASSVKHYTLDETTAHDLSLGRPPDEPQSGETTGLTHLHKVVTTDIGRSKLQQWLHNPTLDRNEIGARQWASLELAALDNWSQVTACVRDIDSTLNALRLPEETHKMARGVHWVNVPLRVLCLFMAVALGPGKWYQAFFILLFLGNMLGAEAIDLKSCRKSLQRTQQLRVQVCALERLLDESSCERLVDIQKQLQGILGAYPERSRRSGRIPEDTVLSHIAKHNKLWFILDYITGYSRYSLANASKDATVWLTETRAVLDECRSQLEIYAGQAFFAAEHSFVAPQIVRTEGNDAVVEIEEAHHPYILLCRTPKEDENGEMLPLPESVTNDVYLSTSEKHPQMLVVTGPNACGKSLYTITAGLLCVYALAGLLVPAKYMRISLQRVVSVMRVSGSIVDGTSLFMSQTGRLKTLMDITEAHRDSANEPLPVFVLVDELAGGTSPYEREALEQTAVEELIINGAICLLTTHQHSISRLAKRMGELKNVRVKRKPRFQVTEGYATSSQADLVLKEIGFSDRFMSRYYRNLEEVKALAHKVEE